jgi:hypothetical protein
MLLYIMHGGKTLVVKLSMFGGRASDVLADVVDLKLSNVNFRPVQTSSTSHNIVGKCCGSVLDDHA